MTVLALPPRTVPHEPSGPTPAVTDERKREILSTLIEALNQAAEQLGDLDPWKWACLGIGSNMRESINDTTTVQPSVTLEVIV